MMIDLTHSILMVFEQIFSIWRQEGKLAWNLDLRFSLFRPVQISHFKKLSDICDLWCAVNHMTLKFIVEGKNVECWLVFQRGIFEQDKTGKILYFILIWNISPFCRVDASFAVRYNLLMVICYALRVGVAVIPHIWGAEVHPLPVTADGIQEQEQRVRN